MSLPPQSYLEQHRARWEEVARPDPLSTGMHAASEHAKQSILRAVSRALVNFAAGEPVQVEFRRGASFANMATRRVNINGNLLEEAAADPSKIEAFLAHAVHEGGHIFLTRPLALSDDERENDGRLLHWIHNIIEDERIEPGIAAIYPPLASPLRAEREAMHETAPLKWEALEAFFALVRTPDALPAEIWGKHATLLSSAAAILTPFPEDHDGVERATRRILELFPASLRKAAREGRWRRLPGGEHLGDDKAVGSRGGWRRMLEDSLGGPGEIGAGWPELSFREPEPDAVAYEEVRRQVAVDADRVSGAFAAMLPARGRQRARTGRLDRRRLHATPYDDRVFRPVEPQILGIDVLLVIDLSSSMRGDSEEIARRLGITIAEAAMTRSDIRLFVYGHAADIDDSAGTVIFRFATPACGRVNALGRLPVEGNNRDAHAYLEIAADVEAFATRRARARVALLVGDGAPSANDFHGQAAVEATREAIAKLERSWGPVLVMATDHSPVLESLAPRPGAVVEPERAIEGLMAFLARTVGRTEG